MKTNNTQNTPRIKQRCISVNKLSITDFEIDITKKLKECLVSVITTAGFDLNCPCKSLDKHCHNVLMGAVEDETQFRADLCGRHGLAPAVGGIAEGRDEQRHMVMRAFVRKAEADGDDVQEHRAIARAAQIVASMEAQLVGAGLRALARQERRVAAAVGVRRRAVL